MGPMTWNPLHVRSTEVCEVILCGWVGGLAWYSLGAADEDGRIVDLETGTLNPSITHWARLSPPKQEWSEPS